MLEPASRQRIRLPLGLVLALCCVVLGVWLVGSATAASALASHSGTSGGSGGSGGSDAVQSHSPSPTHADHALESLMLAVPLPGLVDFVLVGPGATNGVLTAETLGSYSNDPSQVEHQFNQYSSESGFAGWIKTWQDGVSTNQLVEIAIRFHDAQEASTNGDGFISALSAGQSTGTRSDVRSIPGAVAFSIDEPASTSGGATIPAQQVQAVVFADGDYLIALYSNSPDGAGSHPIAAGTATALALQQYQDLASANGSASASASASKGAAGLASHRGSNNGSTALTVGVALLAGVVLLISVLAVMNGRRARRTRLAARAGGVGRAGPPGTDSAARSAKSARPARQARPTRPAQLARPASERTRGGANGSGRKTARDPDRKGDREPDLEPASASGRHDAGSGSGSGSGKRPHIPAGTTRKGAHAGRLAVVSIRNGRGPRAHRLADSRNKHPSAAAALAQSRPKDTAAGWYQDPSDSNGRRIRYWDGANWTTHVAEPAEPAQPSSPGITET